MDAQAAEIAVRGDDGTLRYFTITEKREYAGTICSYEPCSKRFVSPRGEKARFCSANCRLREHRRDHPEGDSA